MRTFPLKKPFVFFRIWHKQHKLVWRHKVVQMFSIYEQIASQYRIRVFNILWWCHNSKFGKLPNGFGMLFRCDLMPWPRGRKYLLCSVFNGLVVTLMLCLYKIRLFHLCMVKLHKTYPCTCFIVFNKAKYCPTSSSGDGTYESVRSKISWDLFDDIVRIPLHLRVVVLLKNVKSKWNNVVNGEISAYRAKAH